MGPGNHRAFQQREVFRARKTVSSGQISSDENFVLLLPAALRLSPPSEISLVTCDIGLSVRPLASTIGRDFRLPTFCFLSPSVTTRLFFRSYEHFMQLLSCAFLLRRSSEAFVCACDCESSRCLRWKRRSRSTRLPRRIVSTPHRPMAPRLQDYPSPAERVRASMVLRSMVPFAKFSPASALSPDLAYRVCLVGNSSSLSMPLLILVPVLMPPQHTQIVALYLTPYYEFE